MKPEYTWSCVLREFEDMYPRDYVLSNESSPVFWTLFIKQLEERNIIQRVTIRHLNGKKMLPNTEAYARVMRRIL